MARDSLKPEMLAQQFKGRLNTQHKTIKLWVCWAGRGLEKGEGLAFVFWQAMRGDFPQLSVWAYVAPVSIPEPGGKDVAAFRAATDEELEAARRDSTYPLKKMPERYSDGVELGPPKDFRQTIGHQGVTPSLKRTPSMIERDQAASSSPSPIPLLRTLRLCYWASQME